MYLTSRERWNFDSIHLPLQIVDVDLLFIVSLYLYHLFHETQPFTWKEANISVPHSWMSFDSASL